MNIFEGTGEARSLCTHFQDGMITLSEFIDKVCELATEVEFPPEYVDPNTGLKIEQFERASQ